MSTSSSYFFDSGTSTFDSSMFWFTCAYSQMRISFHQIFGWELTLLEPTNYWNRVPIKWLPYIHFYNIPISSNESNYNSPIQLIRSLGSSNDFISFKLDIDSPDIEICEVMTSCGWGKRVPYESHGLLLDRPHVLKYFIELRQRGVRAHIWP
eukprot:gene19197-25046_t